MTKEQLIEMLWLKAKKFDPSIRRAVIEGVTPNVWDEMVNKYLLAAPDMGYLFAKEHSFTIAFNSESGESGSYPDEANSHTMDIPYRVISPIYFRGGVFRVRGERNQLFVPVRWNEIRSMNNDAVNDLIQSGTIMYATLDNTIYFVGKPGVEVSGSIDFLISLSEYESDEVVPMPISSRQDVSYQETFVNDVLSVLLGERPERKSIDDINQP
jgi:hypothetical protein